MYYPSSENKGADQLRSYCEADLRLCFRLGRLLVFPCGSSYVKAKTDATSHGMSHGKMECVDLRSDQLDKTDSLEFIASL